MSMTTAMRELRVRIPGPLRERLMERAAADQVSPGRALEKALRSYVLREEARRRASALSDRQRARDGEATA